MTAATLAITDFLLARFDEDEAEARDAAGWNAAGTEQASGRWLCDGMNSVVDEDRRLVVFGDGPAPSDSQASHIARHDPARVLAEVKAKRRIVEGWGDVLERHMRETFPAVDEDAERGGKWVAEYALRALAAVYADHEDFQPEWAL